MKRVWGSIAVVLFFACSADAQPEPRPDPLDPSYHHDQWKTLPQDQVREFRAFVTSFDGDDDNDGDGQGDTWAIPEWVSYEMHRAPKRKPYEPRPSTWMTDRGLYEDDIAPRHQSYVRSNYDRGHMCMREHGRRLGKNADWNTHTLLNACPQVHSFNAGIWLSMENQCGEWANTYEKIWVICGPIILDRDEHHTPSEWIGKGKEKKVAVPDQFFKIVVKESDNPSRPDVLALIYPHDEELDDSSEDADHTPYLVSVRDIEQQTGLNFFTSLPAADQEAIETDAATELWP